MHIVLDFKCIEHECVVHPHSVYYVSLLSHHHHDLLLFECKVLKHLLPLVNELSGLHLLDGKLVEE